MTTIERLYIGIDPGIGGAVAAVTAQGKFIDVMSMPIQMKKSGRNEVDALALFEWFEALRGKRILYTMLERVSAMPGQGVSGMFSLGDSFGCARAIATAASEQLAYAAPGVWKKKMSLTKNKAYSLTLARQFFPEAAADYLPLKKHEGRAEALLLAKYAAQHHSW